MTVTRPSILEVLSSSGWVTLERHLETLPERVDESIKRAHEMRSRLREELLSSNPDLSQMIRRPSAEAMRRAESLLLNGCVAAADGTIAPVPLLAGSKIQVGVVIVSNTGDVVDLVTQVFEADLTSGVSTARDFFEQLHQIRGFSNILSRAIMLFGERRLLLDHPADWRMIHGELVPFELRTGAGRPATNLQPAFDLVERFIETEHFLAVTESSNDLDILNFSVLLEPGEYMEFRKLRDDLEGFLYGTDNVQRANFIQSDRRRFREFIQRVGDRVSVILIKAGPRPFLLECHSDHIEEAASLFLADSLWTRGLPVDGSGFVARGFPFHIDLADQVAGTLFRASDFRSFVEARLFASEGETGFLDLDPRRTRA